MGILTASSSEEISEQEQVEDTQDFVDEGGACYFDPATGLRKCE
jgi:hypothetical protein